MRIKEVVTNGRNTRLFQIDGKWLVVIHEKDDKAEIATGESHLDEAHRAKLVDFMGKELVSA